MTILTDEYAYRIFVLCVTPLKLIGTPSIFPYAIGTYAMGELADEDTEDAPETFYWANKPFETSSSDTPPSAVFQPYLLNAFNYSASVPLPGSTEGVGSTGFGFVQVANINTLDTQISNYAWGGREAAIWLGGTTDKGKAAEVVLDFDAYTQLYALQVAGISADEQSFEISVRDPTFDLEVPIQETLYLGDGTTEYEGDAALKGRPKPLAFGTCFRVTAVYVGQAGGSNYIYQYHDGSGCAVTSAWNKGVLLTDEGNAGEGGLINASITTANFKTDETLGLLALSDEPDGDVVVDLVGLGGDSASPELYTVSTIINYILTTYTPSISLDTASPNSFSTFGQYQAGYWVGIDAELVADIITQLTSSMDGWWTFNRLGKLTIGEHASISSATLAATIDGTDNINSVPIIAAGSLQRTPGPPPVFKQSFAYKKYFTTIDFEQDPPEVRKLFRNKRQKRKLRRAGLSTVADTVNPDEFADWKREFRNLPISESGYVRDIYKHAVSVDHLSLLTDETEVTDLASEIFSRDAKARNFYRCTINRNLFTLNAGDVVLLKHDRFGLSGGKRGRITSIVEDAQSETSELEILIDDSSS